MTKATAKTTPIVGYFRVSTSRQGQSGLGLEAQRAAVAAHVAHTGAPLIAEFTEVETGTRKRHRPELDRALVQARASGAVLVIAKFDRLARDVAFLSTLMNGDVPFRALDLPHASRFTPSLPSPKRKQPTFRNGPRRHWPPRRARRASD